MERLTQLANEIPVANIGSQDFPITELVLAGLSIRTRVSTSDLPKVLAVSTRWRGYWHSGSKTHYVCALIGGKKVYLHRVVTDAAIGTEVDHRNHDGLDNRGSRLRVTTRSENVRNTRSRNNKHGHRGVRWYAPTGRWHARARVNGKTQHLGYFSTAKEAGDAYDKFFAERFGEGL